MNSTLAEYGLDGLSTEQRLTLIDLLWDSLDVPEYKQSETQLTELGRRRDAALANPGVGVAWDELRTLWMADIK